MAVEEENDNIHRPKGQANNECSGGVDGSNNTAEMRELSQQGDDSSCYSADEALCELLGISSMNDVGCIDEDDNHDDEDNTLNDGNNESLKRIAPNIITSISDLLAVRSSAYIQTVIEQLGLREQYRRNGIVVLPTALSIPAVIMRRLTEELIWGRSHDTNLHRTYETISVASPSGSTTQAIASGVTQHRMLTRLENFVDHHPEWYSLCHGYLRECVSAVLGTDQCLYKEKLNLKPPGGSGFAPHLDTPSLRVAASTDRDSPRDFVTVMVAIDDMNSTNGCLRFSPGPWSEECSVPVIEPTLNGNPDADGRAGAIPSSVADQLNFEDLQCRGGTIAIFDGWVPHRSSRNTSPFARRAVFLTYNPLSQGDFHTLYYHRMSKLRNQWRHRVGLLTPDEQCDRDAFATVPGGTKV